DRQGFAIALEQGRQAKGAAGGLHKALEVIERHIGVAEGRQVLGKLVADHGHQVERDAAGGQPHNVCVRPRRVFDAPGGKESPTAFSVVKKAFYVKRLHGWPRVRSEAAHLAPRNASCSSPRVPTATEAEECSVWVWR